MSEEGYRIRPANAEHAQLIADLSFQEFADTSLQERPLYNAIDDWQQRYSPTMVATDVENQFLGFARSKPNETGSFSRFDGQVAVLVQVAVVPKARGRGIGGALVERSLKALRLFGYARVFAQIQPSLVTWYEERGWKIHPEGQCAGWIEPPIPSDDEWFPDVARGTFAPLLMMSFLPRHPHLIEYRLKEAEPIVEVWFDGRTRQADAIERCHRALIAKLDMTPKLEARIPSADDPRDIGRRATS